MVMTIHRTRSNATTALFQLRFFITSFPPHLFFYKKKRRSSLAKRLRFLLSYSYSFSFVALSSYSVTCQKHLYHTKLLSEFQDYFTYFFIFLNFSSDIPVSTPSFPLPSVPQTGFGKGIVQGYNRRSRFRFPLPSLLHQRSVQSRSGGVLPQYY